VNINPLWPHNDSQKNKKKASMMAALTNTDEGSDEKSSYFQLYASLMILLMTFFIVIYAYSTYSHAKFQLAKESLFKAFETLGVAETREIISFLKSKMTVTQTDEHRQFFISLSEISSELEKEFKGCNVNFKRYETIITVPDQQIFIGDRIAFTKDANKILNKIIGYIKKDVYSQIIIGGHFMSAYPNETTVKSNRFDWIISSLRSARIAQYFVDKRLDYTRVSSIGYGNKHPIFDLDKFPSAKLEDNNRIEIIIRKPEATTEDELELYIS